jgi:hypothetical protein
MDGVLASGKPEDYELYKTDRRTPRAGVA